MKKYQIIYADPPWEYEPWDYPEKSIKAVNKYYPTMSLEEIKAIDIPAEKDSWLILWTTAPKISEGLETLRAWGFNYRTMAIWDKGNGLGKFFRIYHEIILIGKKGNPPMPKYTEQSIFKEARREHSRKPYSVFRWINKAFPELTKIELFCRKENTLFWEQEKKDNLWDVWGNEVKSDIKL